MKIGIYVDAENVMKNGGWGLWYDQLWILASKLAQGTPADIVRATTYLAWDSEREAAERDAYMKNSGYRAQIRRQGFKVFLKPIHRYTDAATGKTVQKADCDMDIALDAIQEARNLDLVVLVSGDGDFVRLVCDLQRMGVRVVVVGFRNVSRALKDAADEYIQGDLVEGLVPPQDRGKGATEDAPPDPEPAAVLPPVEGGENSGKTA